MTEATIFSLSSGKPPAGVAVIRLSGPQTVRALEAISGPLPPARQASLRTLRRPDGEMLDQGLVLYFKGPQSFTGEDCAELQVHGSRAVVNAISETLKDLGLRQAEAGEFARRAFEHGRLDLVEVEGLADLVSAETEMQRKLAIQTGTGGLSQVYRGWADRLTYARAMIEAELDFADEEDAPDSAEALMAVDLAKLLVEMERALASSNSAEIIRNGFKVAIVGAPNAGKSSLLNAMAKREVAIVTDIAGTTRDVVTVELDLDGYLVKLFDTAGIREADDLVEREGIRRAKLVASEADLVLHLISDASVPEEEIGVEPSLVVTVASKSDLGVPDTKHDLAISCQDGIGLDDLRQLIVGKAAASTSLDLSVGRQRHLEHIQIASKFIENALEEPRLELKADALRAAGDALGRITGRVDVEDLLDVIFSQFCIGK